MSAAAAAIAGLIEMRAAAGALPAAEVAVRRRGAALARARLIAVDRRAQRAARVAPLEARGREDAIEPFALGLPLHRPRARHDPRRHRALVPSRATSAAARRSSMRPFVHEPMNTRSIAISVSAHARREPM